MIDQEQLEKATPWEIQQQLEFFQRDIDHAEQWLQELKRAKSVISIALRQKNNGAHEFKGLARGQGYV